MIDLMYEVILYDLLGYTVNSYEVIPYHSIALVLTIILSIIFVFGFFKLALFLLTFPFRSLL